METSNELWIDVQGYEGLYQVSNKGNVKYLAKKKGYYFLDEGIFKKQVNKYGYEQVLLSKKVDDESTKKCFLVHRLVLNHFNPTIDSTLEVNHKNGIKTDNTLENLEWVTHSTNMKHAFEYNLKVAQKGEESVLSKITEKEALNIKHSTLKPSELAKQYNITAVQIWRIQNGKRWSHLS